MRRLYDFSCNLEAADENSEGSEIEDWINQLLGATPVRYAN